MVFYLLHVRGIGGFFFDGGYDNTVEATGHYQIENAQVITDIDSHTVIGDLPRYPHADGRNFSFAYPQAGEALFSPGVDAELGKQFDSDLFESSDIFGDTELKSAQVKDWIEDELAGVVGGNAAAPEDIDDVDTLPP